MGLFRSIGRAFRSVTSIASKIGGGLLSGGLSGLMKPFGGMLGKIMDKFPLGNVLSKVTGFLGKLGPLASMAGGPMGMIGGLLGKLGGMGGGLGKIAEFATNLMSKFGGAQNLPLPGLNNLQELFAKGQAQNMLASFLK